MQNVRKLIQVIRKLLVVVEEEASRNPAFAERIEAICNVLPTSTKTRGQKKPVVSQIPDALAIYQERGEEEFRYWLRSLDTPVLKAIIRENGFDPARAGSRWTDADKFITLIVEQTQATLKRGTAFLRSKEPDTPANSDP